MAWNSTDKSKILSSLDILKQEMDLVQITLKGTKMINDKKMQEIKY
jgi:hypothetical protein